MNERARRESNRARHQREGRYRPNRQAQAPAQGNNPRADPNTAEALPRPDLAAIVGEVGDEVLEDMDLNQ